MEKNSAAGRMKFKFEFDSEELVLLRAGLQSELERAQRQIELFRGRPDCVDLVKSMAEGIATLAALRNKLRAW